MKDSRITIKCSSYTARLWKKYVALSESRDFEEALLNLLRESGWLSKLKATEVIQKELI